MIAKKQKFTTYLLKIIVVLLLITIVVVCLTVIWFVRIESQFTDKLYPNVYINGISFGAKSRLDVTDYFNKKNQLFNKTKIYVLYKNEPVATFSAQQLKVAYDGAGIAQRAYLIGRSSNWPSRIYQKIATILNYSRFDFNINIDWDRKPFQEFISEAEEKYNKPAKNALFKFEDGKVISFQQEEKGLKINYDQFNKDVENIFIDFEKKKPDIKIVLTDIIIEPGITLAKANNLGIEEFITEGKSDFNHSIAERIHNITLASSKFNGVLIPKDEVFSFNKTVGDISSLTGYKPAYIIKSGRTVLGDGGGVCQVSTTLFRAALNAGLPIVERHAHAYRVGYYENDSKPGFDATVFDPTADLKIKNNTSAYILIQTEIDRNNNWLYFRLYGKKDQRKIEISPVAVTDIQPPLPDLYQDDPNLKKGVVKQIDFPAWGAKVKFNYKVMLKNKPLTEQTFVSNYRSWQAVYLKGSAD